MKKKILLVATLFVVGVQAGRFDGVAEQLKILLFPDDELAHKMLVDDQNVQIASALYCAIQSAGKNDDLAGVQLAAAIESLRGSLVTDLRLQRIMAHIVRLCTLGECDARSAGLMSLPTIIIKDVPSLDAKMFERPRPRAAAKPVVTSSFLL
jgi:hypothetical protein